MKKTIYLAALISALVLTSSIVHAQKGTGSTSVSGERDRIKLQDPSTHEDDADDVIGDKQGSGSKTQNQTSVQNKGKDSQLKVTTQNSEADLADGEEPENGQGKGSLSRSDVARLHMSAVAQKVEEFLADETRSGGIGEKISEFAKAQRLVQTEIEDTLGAIDKRKGVIKSLLGPNYRAVKKMEELMEKNQLRIQQLQELKNKVQNQGEEVQLQEMIQAMVDQDTALQDQVRATKNVKSVFGWIMRLFK